MRDPKRKDKFFNSKQLLAGDASPETIQFRAFMSRYAHYVLLRTQCFSGMFEEISALPKPDKKGAKSKPITATAEDRACRNRQITAIIPQSRSRQQKTHRDSINLGTENQCTDMRYTTRHTETVHFHPLLYCGNKGTTH